MGDPGGPSAAHDESKHRLWRMYAVLFVALALAVASAAALASALPAEAQEDPEFQVVGGKPVPKGKYPFMAALEGRVRDEDGRPTPFQQFCGATLVDRGHVLTAAHCAEIIGGRRGFLALEDVRVVVGQTVLGTGQGKVRRIERLADISIHPRWTPNTSLSYDVAVIKLDRPVRGVKPIRPATARQNALERPGSVATVIGWGIATSLPPLGGGGNIRIPRRLQEAEVPIVSDEEAREAHGKLYNPRTMVAAGEKGKSVCFGDSGGPLFAEVSGRPRQIGIVSWGLGCARQRFPAAYAEVNAPLALGFIERATSRD